MPFTWFNRDDFQEKEKMPEQQQPLDAIQIDKIERDPTIVKIHIDACVRALRDEDGNCKDRELSLAVTNLRQAAMWIDEHLRLS